ncbi:hypothetical protein [Prosthecodimorpha staleyi]|uniref:Uncharacterized protein n=1 Tax=Prosthecodimorpha staleyi TaxID=2840188 RepID=A0A947D9J5_9HYPH|nr:hypothetical protein [Prosthecodimorpha staleyi]MBT9292136.1 hypothetical protein [Prosthecodimorpha staleyi]
MTPAPPPRPAFILRYDRAVASLAMAAAAFTTAYALSNGLPLAVPAALAGLVATFILWRPMVARPPRTSLWGAIGLGAAVVLISYPVMLAIGLPFEAILSEKPIEAPAGSSGRLEDFAYMFAFAMTYGLFFGVMLTGWITLPIGMAVAWTIAFWRRSAEKCLAEGVPGAPAPMTSEPPR